MEFTFAKEANNSAASQIQFPVIATYAQVAAALRLSKRTVYKMTCKKRFMKGVYLGGGRFNMSRLKEYIEKNGSYLQESKA